MHFKSAVILCALYLITSAWSFGLNSKQLTEIIRLYENHKMSSSENIEENITKFKKEFFGIQEPEKIIPCDSSPKLPTGPIVVTEDDTCTGQKLPTEPIVVTEDNTCTDEANGVDLKKLLLTLAYEDKITHDCFKTQMLTSFEVEFFLSVFTEYANSSHQDGCLSLQQLPSVLKDLKLVDTEIEKVVQELKVTNKKRKFLNFDPIEAQFLINEADFLLIMLKVKPEGYGLNLQQIEKFIDLYDTCPKLVVSGGIDPLEIQKIFKEFGMADPKHNSKMLFTPNRSAEKELMELMLVTAERGRKKLTKKRSMHTCLVRSILSDFVENDKDSDGILSKKELSTVMKSMNSYWFSMPDLDNPRNDDRGKTNIAKFIKIMFSYYIEDIE